MNERQVDDVEPCDDCGGSGLRADAIERAGEPLTAAEREMLDSTRCVGCAGTGRADAYDDL